MVTASPIGTGTRGPMGLPGQRGPRGPAGEPGAAADTKVIQQLRKEVAALGRRVERLKKRINHVGRD